MSEPTPWTDNARDFMCNRRDLVLAPKARGLKFVNEMRRDIARQDAARAKLAKQAQSTLRVIAGGKD